VLRRGPFARRTGYFKKAFFALLASRYAEALLLEEALLVRSLKIKKCYAGSIFFIFLFILFIFLFAALRS
jgi:hypothetical protein